MKATEPKLDERTEQPTVGIRTQVSMSELGRVIPQLNGEVFAWLQQQGQSPSGPPFIRYYVIDMPGMMDIELGWPVAQALNGDERVSASAFPAGRYASLIYTGVENGIEGNKALLDWGAEQGLVWDTYGSTKGDGFGARYESFLTGPEDDPDPGNWDTEVAIRLADE